MHDCNLQHDKIDHFIWLCLQKQYPLIWWSVGIQYGLGCSLSLRLPERASGKKRGSLRKKTPFLCIKNINIIIMLLKGPPLRSLKNIYFNLPHRLGSPPPPNISSNQLSFFVSKVTCSSFSPSSSSFSPSFSLSSSLALAFASSSVSTLTLISTALSLPMNSLLLNFARKV